MTTDVGNAPRFASAFVATTAIGCFAYFSLALLLLHVLKPDYEPSTYMISDYANGPYGWIMTTCFLALSCGCLMLLLGLVRIGPRSVAARLGTVLLGIASIGMLVAAIFPTDPEGAPLSRSGFIHGITFLPNVLSIILATGLLSASFGSDPRWRAYRRTAGTLVSLVVLAFFLQFIVLVRGAPPGLANRLFVAVLLAWLLTTSVRLRALTRE
jgi:hypothetical membrane protein